MQHYADAALRLVRLDDARMPAMRMEGGRMSDLFDDPPPLPLPRRRPTPKPMEPAEVIARAVFPASFSDNPAVAIVPTGDIATNRARLVEVCRPAVEALRQKGLIP